MNTAMQPLLKSTEKMIFCAKISGAVYLSVRGVSFHARVSLYCPCIDKSRK